ncbi:MAG: G-D-S-L family lipolytic protein [Williamsia sp.]|nr:G-D-S-L family lipolytic protein [Williamsia sp.]
MKFRFLPVSLVALVFIFSSCQKEDIPSAPQSTQQGAAAADFTRYISVGNSITAGYSNGGLYNGGLFLEGQQVAYPFLIATQMKSAGGGNFFQPLFPAEQANGSGYLRLDGVKPDGTPNIVPVTDKLAIRGTVTIPGFGPVTLYTKYTGDLNNYGVPGLKLQQITSPLIGNLNPYFERLLPGNAGTNTTSYLDFVTAKPFTFFSNWLGNNDVLGYATSGGEGDVLTDSIQFAGLYALLLSNLTKNGAGGVIATIPDVTVLPYLNTVTVQALKVAVSRITAANIYISALEPATGKYVARAATDADLIGLTFNAGSLGQVVNGMPGYGITLSNPIASKEVLDAAETALARQYVGAYNRIIRSASTLYGLALFDSMDFLNKVKAGMVVDGVTVNADFITGGVFSLDGVHLTPRGNALTANEFIKAINSKYNTTIPRLDVSAFKGVL